MDYTLDIGAWNQVFAVPTALVDRHLKLAGKEQLQAILWILRHAGEAFTADQLADALGISTDSALDALDYWKNMGLLAGRGGDLCPLPQPEQQQTAEPIEAPTAAVITEPSVQQETISQLQPQAEPEKVPKKKRMPKPDTSYLVKRQEESAEIQYLIQEAQATLGIVSPAMSAVLLASVDDYGLPVEVVTMLLHYAVTVGKTSTNYIDSVARDWAESGIFTLEAAEEKLQQLSQARLAWSKISSLAGLQKRAPTKKEEECAVRWLDEWKFSQEMISAAYERCVDHTGKFNTAYMNKVLERWYKLGLKAVAEVEEAEAKKAAATTEKAKSYDINELERMSFFDVPEDLL